jgi:hypothetical protein
MTRPPDLEAAIKNVDLAAQFRAEADQAMHRRRVLLVCSVALAETSTVATARRVLEQWSGPADIRRDAIQLLDALASDAPPRAGQHRKGDQ